MKNLGFTLKDQKVEEIVDSEIGSRPHMLKIKTAFYTERPFFGNEERTFGARKLGFPIFHNHYLVGRRGKY